MSPKIKLVTRQSPLALWQSNWVKAQLALAADQPEIELVKVVTDGDRWLNAPLYELGGKALFVKALEGQLLDKTVDCAVHSLKDMPSQLPEGLCIGAITAREDPSDSFVSHQYRQLADLPAGACVGTSSLRRQSQVLHHFPHLTVKPVRGNVGTRIEKCTKGDVDALLLATSGLQRLQVGGSIAHALPVDTFIPAPGQGALAIECRADDDAMLARLKALHHVPTALCVRAERSMNAELGGSCHFPIAGYATLQDDHLQLTGYVGSLDGQQIFKTSATSGIEDPEQLGRTVAHTLLAQGADQIIKEMRDHGKA
jgi:hydroxymethylbilane synthase